MTALCLDVTPLVPTKANGQTFLRDTGTHWGCTSDLHRLPESFRSEEHHRANIFSQIQALNRVLLERKSQDQDFHHIPSPLPGNRRGNLSNSKRWEASHYQFGTGTSSTTGKTRSLLGKEAERKKVFFRLFFLRANSSSCPSELSLAKPAAKPQLQPLLPLSEGECLSSSLCW